MERIDGIVAAVKRSSHAAVWNAMAVSDSPLIQTRILTQDLGRFGGKVVVDPQHGLIVSAGYTDPAGIAFVAKVCCLWMNHTRVIRRYERPHPDSRHK